jgi:hypothetical protein
VDRVDSDDSSDIRAVDAVDSVSDGERLSTGGTLLPPPGSCRVRDFVSCGGYLLVHDSILPGFLEDFTLVRGPDVKSGRVVYAT